MGLVISLILTAWISFGAASTNVAHPTLPVSTADCPVFNNTYLPDTNSLMTVSHNETYSSTPGHFSTAAEFETLTAAVDASKE